MFSLEQVRELVWGRVWSCLRSINSYWKSAGISILGWLILIMSGHVQGTWVTKQTEMDMVFSERCDGGEKACA